jgi:transcription elongation factor Elf1
MVFAFFVCKNINMKKYLEDGELWEEIPIYTDYHDIYKYLEVENVQLHEPIPNNATVWHGRNDSTATHGANATAISTVSAK